jgi:hypothetical protein
MVVEQPSLLQFEGDYAEEVARVWSALEARIAGVDLAHMAYLCPCGRGCLIAST